ncbi:MAG: FAD-dependent oxidoreductase [Nocardioidaceae bacterium]
MRTVRAAVVGGGIIGVAVARQLVRTSDDIDVTVFEKEDRLAAHQTGRQQWRGPRRALLPTRQPQGDPVSSRR